MPRMTNPSQLVIAGLLVLTLGCAAVATAQRFVWPPTRATTSKPEVEAPSEAGWDADLPSDARNASPVAMPAMRVTPVSTGQSAALDWRILENPQGPHTALFFDPVRQVFAVYHVDSASGQIMLRSVRSLAADLRLEQFNSSNPAPKDIKSMLDEAR